jgi:site-specific recombinase XerD
MTNPEVIDGELVPIGEPATAPTLPNGDRLTPDEWATIQADELAADEHLESIKPKNTTDAYDSDWQQWQRFRAWRAERGQSVHIYAGTPGTLVAFIRWLDEVEGRAPATIERRLAGVVSQLRENGIEPGDTAARKTRAAINDIKKDREKKARGRGRATAVTADHLTVMVGACDQDTLSGLRNRAMVLVGFTIASRVSEAAGLLVTDIEVHVDGLLVHVPPVKLRNGSSARTVWVPASDDPDSPMCPRAAWITWTDAAKLTSGPAWRSINRWGTVGQQPLSTKTFERVITNLARRAGIALSWHGLRAGLITQLIEADQHPSHVRQISGHAEGSPEFEKYVRPVLQKKNSPIKALKL